MTHWFCPFCKVINRFLQLITSPPPFWNSYTSQHLTPPNLPKPWACPCISKNKWTEIRLMWASWDCNYKNFKSIYIQKWKCFWWYHCFYLSSYTSKPNMKFPTTTEKCVLKFPIKIIMDMGKGSVSLHKSSHLNSIIQ